MGTATSLSVFTDWTSIFVVVRQTEQMRDQVALVGTTCMLLMTLTALLRADCLA